MRAPTSCVPQMGGAGPGNPPEEGWLVGEKGCKVSFLSQRSKRNHSQFLEGRGDGGGYVCVCAPVCVHVCVFEGITPENPELGPFQQKDGC